MHGVFETYIFPVLFKGQKLNRGHKISIAAAVALCSLYMYYHKVMAPPRSLRHLPRASFFQIWKANFQNKSLEKCTQEITLPLASQTPSGLYLRLNGRGWSVSIAGTGALKKFLQNTDIFPKAVGRGSGKTFIACFGRGSLIFSNGHSWKYQRAMAMSAFRRSALNYGFGELIAKLFDSMDKKLDQGSLNIGDLTFRFTLDRLGLGLLGVNFDSIQNNNSEWFIQYISIVKHVFHPFFLAYPIFDTTLLPLFPERQKAYRHLQKFNQTIEEIVASKRKVINQKHQPLDRAIDHGKDLLTLILEDDMNDEGSMTDEALRLNMVTFLIAGQPPLANILAFIIYHLSINQDVQKQAREQVINVLGDADKDVTPNVDQLRAIPFINMIIKETLRINPPAALSAPRIVTQDTELAGTSIPKGTLMSLDIYALHVNPNIWKDPNTFNPERFADGGEAEEAGINGWLPFLGGPRQCLAMNFSLATLRVSLAMFLRKYEWSLPKDSKHKDGVITTDITFATPKDLYIDFKKRY